MKIAQSQLQMESSHVSLQHVEVRESMRMWVGTQRPDFENRRPERALDTVSLSDEALAAQKADDAEATKDATESDPRMLLIRSLIEAMTGRRVRLFDASDLQPASGSVAAGGETTPAPELAANRPAGFGVEYDYHESRTEFESTRFSASGSVVTADGRKIAFDLQLGMERSYHEETNVSLRLGDAQKKDPLVINFSGNAAALTDTRFAFDLDADGTTENINFVRPGSGFLVFDRNGDGKANDGSELFGTATGQGFAELAQLDDDNNGWIDENDAAWSRLGVWTRNAESKDSLQGLAASGVGAIALTHVGTPFDLKNGANQTLGQIRSSGIYLKENGGAGTVQQVDLSV